MGLSTLSRMCAIVIYWIDEVLQRCTDNSLDPTEGEVLRGAFRQYIYELGAGEEWGLGCKSKIISSAVIGVGVQIG